MSRCPNCGAHREDDADHCPVCGETFPGPHLSEVTGSHWYQQTDRLVILAVLVWPVALYGLYRRDAWNQNVDQWVLGICLMMAAVSGLFLRLV